jgi:hypothetical protein
MRRILDAYKQRWFGYESSDKSSSNNPVLEKYGDARIESPPPHYSNNKQRFELGPKKPVLASEKGGRVFGQIRRKLKEPGW